MDNERCPEIPGVCVSSSCCCCCSSCRCCCNASISTYRPITIASRRCVRRVCPCRYPYLLLPRCGMCKSSLEEDSQDEISLLCDDVDDMYHYHYHVLDTVAVMWCRYICVLVMYVLPKIVEDHHHLLQSRYDQHEHHHHTKTKTKTKSNHKHRQHTHIPQHIHQICAHIHIFITSSSSSSSISHLYLDIIKECNITTSRHITFNN